MMRREALLYEKLPGNRVACNLCPHFCRIDEGHRGLCQVRENHDGKLFSLVYHRLSAQNVEPVEKKPLYHFQPGSLTYSIGALGCNMKCPYCINWEVSQISHGQLAIPGEEITPEEIVASARRRGCKSIAYTYVEPSVFFEMTHEVARLARAAGLANIYKTNGFMTEAALAMIQPYLDAANVDLKSFREASYARLGGQLHAVLDCMKLMKACGIWLEITTIIIPQVNDDPAELKDMAQFVAQELGPETPWHLGRFFPAYRMEHVPPTSMAAMYAAKEIALTENLRYVYFSNLPERGQQDTYCSKCNHVLLLRRSSEVREIRLVNGRCPGCGSMLEGVGLENGPPHSNFIGRNRAISKTKDLPA